MSMDGRFSLRLELERLISRCPKLGGVAKFSSLLEEVRNRNPLGGAFLNAFVGFSPKIQNYVKIFFKKKKERKRKLLGREVGIRKLVMIQSIS